MQDIENSTVTLEQIITIVVKVKVVGSNGTIFWFVPYYQYVFCAKEKKELSCDFCSINAVGNVNSSQMHYKVCIDDEEFWVPGYAAVVEGRLRTQEEQNFQTWYDNKIVDQPADYKEEFKKLTGVDINTGETEHNGYDIWLKHMRKRTTEHKIPGEG